MSIGSPQLAVGSQNPFANKTAPGKALDGADIIGVGGYVNALYS